MIAQEADDELGRHMTMIPDFDRPRVGIESDKDRRGECLRKNVIVVP